MAGSVSGTIRSLPPLPRTISVFPSRPRADIGSDELRNPQAGGVEDFQQCHRPRPIMSLPRGGGGEQPVDLLFAQILGKRLALLRPIDRKRRVVGTETLGKQELEQLAQCGKTARGSSGRHPRLGLRMHVLTQAVAVGGEEILAQLAGVIEEPRRSRR